MTRSRTAPQPPEASSIGEGNRCAFGVSCAWMSTRSSAARRLEEALSSAFTAPGAAWIPELTSPMQRRVGRFGKHPAEIPADPRSRPRVARQGNAARWIEILSHPPCSLVPDPPVRALALRPGASSPANPGNHPDRPQRLDASPQRCNQPQRPIAQGAPRPESCQGMQAPGLAAVVIDLERPVGVAANPGCIPGHGDNPFRPGLRGSAASIAHSRLRHIRAL